MYRGLCYTPRQKLRITFIWWKMLIIFHCTHKVNAFGRNEADIPITFTTFGGTCWPSFRCFGQGHGRIPPPPWIHQWSQQKAKGQAQCATVKIHVFLEPGSAQLEQTTQEIVTAETVNSFKNRLDQHWSSINRGWSSRELFCNHVCHTFDVDTK